uniref:Uncharacterized protein n=1 Tax=Salix viminalis TaxID=40686 RepID=A0A6N2LBW8_SALVM
MKHHFYQTFTFICLLENKGLKDGKDNICSWYFHWRCFYQRSTMCWAWRTNQKTISDQMNQAASQAKESHGKNVGLTSGNHQPKAAAAPGPEQAPAPIAAGPRSLRLG